MTPEAANLLKDIAADPRATTEALQMLWETGLERSAVLRHPNCPQSVLLEVAGAAMDSIQPPSIDQLAAFRHPLCPAELLWRAARSRRPELVAAAAACPDLPAELATEIRGMTSLGARDLLGAARLEEAKRLAGAGWNVQLSKADLPAHLKPPEPGEVSSTENEFDYVTMKPNPKWWDQSKPRALAYRGITQDEADSIARLGHIHSTGAFSHSSEGTSFAHDFESAEDAVNFGRTNPDRTRRPNYVLEVQTTPDFEVDPRDKWPKAKAPVPASNIKRAWKFSKRGKPEPVILSGGKWVPHPDLEQPVDDRG